MVSSTSLAPASSIGAKKTNDTFRSSFFSLPLLFESVHGKKSENYLLPLFNFDGAQYITLLCVFHPF